jgi:hypothetical protein
VQLVLEAVLLALIRYFHRSLLQVVDLVEDFRSMVVLVVLVVAVVVDGTYTAPQAQVAQLLLLDKATQAEMVTPRLTQMI